MTPLQGGGGIVLPSGSGQMRPYRLSQCGRRAEWDFKREKKIEFLKF